MTGREKAAAVGAAILAVGLTGYSAWNMLVAGVLSWHIRQPEFIAMAAELFIVWLVLFAAGSLIADGRKACAVFGLVAAAVCWLHEILLPVAASGIYMGYLALVGLWFCRTFVRKKMDTCWNVLVGSAVTLSVFCLLSLVQMGSITKLRLWVAASGAALLVWHQIVCRRDPVWGSGGLGWRGCGTRTGASGKGRPAALTAVPRRLRIVTAAMLASIATLLLLQASRLNLAVDFDSIWYGVRSNVMLDSGNGVYENLGTLGVVYTYSKGLETLTLPLSGLPSYSFILAFNLWMGGLVLLASYRAARIVMEAETALWVPFLMAAVPGIMNMADTAKADMMTLFCQLLMLQAMLWYIRERRADWLAAALAAFCVSLTLKPTAVVFSTAAAGMSFLWMAWKRYFCRMKNRRVGWLLVPAFATVAGIWGRTLHLVGVPVTSIFYQVFQRLGFQVKYPFYASGFPSAGSGGSAAETIGFLAKRLFGVALVPQNDDMAHVIIAWGSVLPLVFAVIWLVYGVAMRPRQEAAGTPAGKTQAGPAGAANPAQAPLFRSQALTYLAWLLFPILAVDLISLYSLSQIDGNYYMFTYALVIFAGVLWLEDLSNANRRICHALLIPAWLYAALFCCLTNWAWALGNGGVHLVNRGYYNHVEAEHQKRAKQGSSAIWDILASNSSNRVIALGEHPGVLTFPCWVQSYVDVSGYWGNPEVVSDAPHFLEYLQFADVDYIYMEKEYVDESVRIYQIVRTLVEEGALYDVRDENGNLILRVRKAWEEAIPAESVQNNLQVFDERYIQHP